MGHYRCVLIYTQGYLEFILVHFAWDYIALITADYVGVSWCISNHQTEQKKPNSSLLLFGSTVKAIMIYKYSIFAPIMKKNDKQ